MLVSALYIVIYIHYIHFSYITVVVCFLRDDEVNGWACGLLWFLLEGFSCC